MKYNVTKTLRADSPYALDWPRWSDFEIAEETARRWIYPTGKRLEPRRLTHDVDLVNVFAPIALAPPQERTAALLAFVRDFGLLGYSTLSSVEFKIAGLPRMADELNWALAHARNVELIMQLHAARRDNLDRLLAALNARVLRVRVPEGFSFLTRDHVATEDDFVDESWMRKRHPRLLRVPLSAAPWFSHIRPVDLRETGSSALDTSRRIIGALLNPNLVGVSREYEPTSGMPRFQFRALVQVLYWQLADRLGHWSIKRCRCGVMFFADHGRQGSHSRQCFRRFYMRDHRKGKLRRKRARKIRRKP